MGEELVPRRMFAAGEEPTSQDQEDRVVNRRTGTRGHVELIRDLDEFLAFPWGRASYHTLATSLIAKDEISLSQASVAICGYVDAIQMEEITQSEAIVIVDSESDGETTEEDGPSEDENMVHLEKQSQATKYCLIPGHAKSIDTECKVPVKAILDDPYEEWSAGLDFSWGDETEDLAVENMLGEKLEKLVASTIQSQQLAFIQTTISLCLQDIDKKIGDALVRQLENMEASLLKGLSQAVGQPSIVRDFPAEGTCVDKSNEPAPFYDNSSLPVSVNIPVVPDNRTPSEAADFCSSSVLRDLNSVPDDGPIEKEIAQASSYVSPLKEHEKEVLEQRKSKRPGIIPGGLQDYKCNPKIVDALIGFVSTRLASGVNAAIYDTTLPVALMNHHSRFVKTAVKDRANLKYTDVPLEKHSEKSPERIYFPFNMDRQHWVGVCIDTKACTLYVLDCNTSLRSDSLLKKELNPIANLIPYVLKHIGYLETNASLKAYTVSRCKGIPQISSQTDAEVLTVLLIEAHAADGLGGCKAITPRLLPDASKQLAVQFFDFISM
ncbi:hypothetical protein N665_0121s0005 [Sinapis alba]|nr:hypothetical protein N665_0121s0005 [Sinapis alba]